MGPTVWCSEQSSETTTSVGCQAPPRPAKRLLYWTTDVRSVVTSDENGRRGWTSKEEEGRRQQSCDLSTNNECWYERVFIE